MTQQDPLTSSKTCWPVSHVESIFLPQFKIRSDNTEEKYRIIKKLARGAFGKVYYVEERDTEKYYALKVVSKGQVGFKQMVLCSLERRLI